MQIQPNVDGSLGPDTRRITSWKAPDFKEREYLVKYNKDGSPIIHLDKSGLSDNARKKKERELLKGFTKKQIRQMKIEARQKAEKIFKQAQIEARKEVKAEMAEEDAKIKEAKQIQDTSVGDEIVKEVADIAIKNFIEKQEARCKECFSPLQSDGKSCTNADCCYWHPPE